ncbi:fibropellin-1-like [Mercenaria mercenaria]|uniref:fibropellin-1-like n=1 Tax=Mercenaria mercenaria TaxID=6596 RepID=UPI00234EF0AB|nr:fibropellin-1-like [Mercenaria mercenaria]
MYAKTDILGIQKGRQCIQDYDECVQNPCINGGTCYNNEGSYTCYCPPGWTGPNCEIDVDECLTNPCLNGGTCINNAGSYTCPCPDGYTGENCETDVNECLTNPCLYGGTCFNTPGSYVCQCIAGRTGVNCERDVDECLELDICKNGGTCINTQGSYLCNCPQQWTGTHCENDVNECILGLSRCENGATCINTIGGYECICPPGYTGPLCAADINECLMNPCLNGGTCINNFGSYVCICLPDYTGPNCENEEETSRETPLRARRNRSEDRNKNSSTPVGFKTAYHENECLMFPCQHGATCNNLPGTYECICADGWEGDNCQIGTTNYRNFIFIRNNTSMSVLSRNRVSTEVLASILLAPMTVYVYLTIQGTIVKMINTKDIVDLVKVRLKKE